MTHDFLFHKQLCKLLLTISQKVHATPGNDWFKIFKKWDTFISEYHCVIC